MIQVGNYRSSFGFNQTVVPVSQSYGVQAVPGTACLSRPGAEWHSPLSPPNHPPAHSETERHNVVVHWTQTGHSFTSGNKSDEEDNESNEDCRPFTPPPPRERLSYTRYQLELLNGIYTHVKYPNSTQKLLVAKRVGISRDQVKIWFQNRRRKDVLAKHGKQGDDDNTEDEPGSVTNEDEENNQDIMVPDVVMKSVIAELKKFKNEHLKSKKTKQKKKNPLTSKTTVLKETETRPKHPGLFSGYDMISPPNQITPSAYTTKSSRPYGFQHAQGSSAFARPKETQREHEGHATERVTSANTSPRNIVSNCLHETKSDARNSLSNGRIVIDRVPSNRHINEPLSDNNMAFDRLINDPNDMFMLSNGHIDNIPVLSDLLTFPGKLPSCDIKSRDYSYNVSQNHFRRPEHEYTHRDNGTTLTDLPLSSRQNGPINALGINRMFPFPFVAEPTAMLSSVRPTELCRPQPHYPSSALSYHDPYQPIPVSSLSNPYYCQQQTAPLSPWHEYSFQEQTNYTQL